VGVIAKRLCILFFVISTDTMAQSRCPEKYLSPHVDENGNGILQCKELGDDKLQWIIDQPQVGKTLTEYPQITFEKGQTVIVSASGSVNVSHDKHRTDWRDYINPEGGGVDRHFHGLIWIPGARIMQDGRLLAVPVGTVPVRIGSVAGSTGKKETTEPEELIIDEPPPGIVPTLRLGYEGAIDRHAWCYLQGTCRTDYPSDPYPKPETSDNKCDRNAKVVVTIATYPAHTSDTAVSSAEVEKDPQASSYGVPASNPARTLKPFDVVSNRVDENGFLFAPQWFNTRTSGDITTLGISDECENFPYKRWWNIYHGTYSPCTQQASYDVPKILTECLLAPGFGQFHGHVNWAPATFVGKLEFQDVSADKDVDLQLQTIADRIIRFPGNKDFGKIGPILTKDSQGSAEYKNSLWLEFATYETTRNFQPPWKTIMFPIGSKALKDLKKEYDNKTAIVTGLLDLDCVHECHTELHPVFAMAIRKKSESEPDVASNDSWAIFVRNAGNEGDCSLDEHYLDRNGYTFFLPAPPGAVRGTPTVTHPNDAFRSNEVGLTWSLERSTDPRSNGVLLKFSFTPTEPACRLIHKGEMVHVSGELHLDWKNASSSEAFQPCEAPNGADTPESELIAAQSDKNEVCRIDRATQEKLERENCTISPHDNVLGASDDFEKSQNEWSAFHRQRQNRPDLSLPTIASQLGDLLGSDIGLFEEALLYNKTSQIQPNFGGRVGIIQTPLGSVEIDGAPGFSRTVKSTNGQNLSVKISDWMAGLKVQFNQQLGMFVEAKGGEIYRSASSGYASTPDFNNFHGHDPIFLAGGGIQPGANVLAKGTKITLRISVDYMRITGTGENMVRITIGPQFQIHRRSE